MWRQLEAAVQELDRAPEVRAIVISGEGEEAFASGADIGSFTAIQSGALPLDEFLQAVLSAPAAIRAATKPVIASIHGVCMGAGMEIAAACDVRIAASDAKFRIPAALIGLGFHKEVVREFVHLIGPANTADVLLSARTFDASEAHHMGFVNRVVDARSLDEAVSTYANAVAGNAPLTLRAAKVAIDRAVAGGSRQDEGAEDVDVLIERCYQSDDFKEGPRAFFEKRKPIFTGS